MPIAKENVVDLRKPQKKKAGPAAEEFDDFEVRPIVKIISLSVFGIALAGLAVYFAISKNYLASILFILAGSTLAISVFSKSASKRTKTKRSNPDSLTDMFAKIIGL